MARRLANFLPAALGAGSACVQALAWRKRALPRLSHRLQTRGPVGASCHTGSQGIVVPLLRKGPENEKRTVLVAEGHRCCGARLGAPIPRNRRWPPSPPRTPTISRRQQRHADRPRCKFQFRSILLATARCTSKSASKSASSSPAGSAHPARFFPPPPHPPAPPP